MGLFSDKKDPGFGKQVPRETGSHLLLGAQDLNDRVQISKYPTTVCGARSTSWWVHMNLFWPLSRDGNLHGSDMSHATTASLNPSIRTPWRVGDAVISRGNAGWTTPKTENPCPYQNCSQRPPAEKTGRGSLLNRPSCPHGDPVG